MVALDSRQQHNRTDTKAAANKSLACWRAKEHISVYRIAKDYSTELTLVSNLQCCVCYQDKDLSGLTAGFAAAGDAAAAGAGAATGVVFSASAGFAIQLLTRPATPPLIPTTSWEKDRYQMLNHRSIRISTVLFSDSLHLVAGSWTLRGAANIAFLPHALDAARAPCRNINHWRLWAFGGFFISLWRQTMD